MATTPIFRESLLEARERIVASRQEIKQQHDAGSPGIQISTRLTDVLDCVVLDLFEEALADVWPSGSEDFRSQVALVPHGGYGRRDVAPYSDVDLMILHAPGAEEKVHPLARRLLRDLSDARLEVGQSLRTPMQACHLATQDPLVCTTLMEARFLAGSVRLYKTFADKFQRSIRRRRRPLFKGISDARRKERVQFGETVYLLEPNIKRSRGGLRDLQLLRWLGFALFGVSEFDALQLQGAISKADQITVRDATEFLLRLRNELHFHAERPNDVLDRGEQVRLATLYGYRGTDGLLPVEQFMKEYFRHTRGVRSVVSNFSDNNRPGQAWSNAFGRIFSHRVDRDYFATPRQIVATQRGLAKLQTSLSEVMRLCELANLHNKRIAPATWETVREAVPHMSGDATPEVCQQFLSLLSQPGRLGELLRRLHELGVLEKIIPAFEHARWLMQFNEYHKYTVDEHCILAVERATEFASDPGILSRVYQGIKQKRILHLALLIHDLGKGFVEDHSEVGLRIAEDTAARLRLPLREAQTLKFLVHKHLLMSHLAFWHDTNDELVVKFAVDLGSPDVLDMLFVLTAADMCAVGPGVWTSWKAEVLTDLYKRTMHHLAGDAPAMDSAQLLEQRRAAVRTCLAGETDQAWFTRQIDALPHAYAVNTPPEQIGAELRALHALQLGDVLALGRYLPESKTTEYVVGTHEQITPGVFHKLTGALSAERLKILSAQINTLAEGLVLDRFYVADPDHPEGPPTRDRLDSVSRRLVQALQSPHGATPEFGQVWCSAATRDRAELMRLPTQVKIDNSTSDHFTIIAVFAHDRSRLLFTISRTIFELGLSVAVAKIGTYIDQVVDVFYVTDQVGCKIVEDERMQEITARLLAAINGMTDE